jgi:hypothetical protein
MKRNFTISGLMRVAEFPAIGCLSRRFKGVPRLRKIIHGDIG